MTLELAETHRRAGNELRKLECILGVETTVEGPDCIETDIVTNRETDGLPPKALEILARYGLSVATCQRQGLCYQALAR